MITSVPFLGKITVITETYQNEKRVSITPKTVKTLSELGFEIYVEFNAGLKAGFNNESYRYAGAIITKNKTLLYQNATIVTWVKPPINTSEVLMKIPKGVVVIGFTNPYHKTKSPHFLAEELGIKLLSLELLPHQQKIMPNMNALAKMSCFAGEIALKEAIQLSTKKSPIILIIGAGHAGMAAAYKVSPRHKLIVVSTSNRFQQDVEQNLKGLYIKFPNKVSPKNATSILKQQQIIINQIICKHQPNIIITTACRFGQPAPKLLLNTTLDNLPAYSIVMDLTASIGGNTTKTTFDKCITLTNGTQICNKSNYPSAEPQSSSIAYSNCLAEIIIKNHVGKHLT
jgi:NAD(P) transhydrogenase subunit alpha